jgi:hypothetical protein
LVFATEHYRDEQAAIPSGMTHSRAITQSGSVNRNRLYAKDSSANIRQRLCHLLGERCVTRANTAMMGQRRKENC